MALSALRALAVTALSATLLLGVSATAHADTPATGDSPVMCTDPIDCPSPYTCEQAGEDYDSTVPVCVARQLPGETKGRETGPGKAPAAPPVAAPRPARSGAVGVNRPAAAAPAAVVAETRQNSNRAPLERSAVTAAVTVAGVTAAAAPVHRYAWRYAF